MEQPKKSDSSKPISMMRTKRELDEKEEKETLDKKRESTLRDLYEIGMNVVCGNWERFWFHPVFWIGFLVVAYLLKLMGIMGFPILKGLIPNVMINEVIWYALILAVWSVIVFVFVKFRYG